MKAWPAPEIPFLPGNGLPVRVFDTATRSLQPSANGRTPRMYVCGITPYDAAHLGHAATYVAFDLLHRAWLDAGLQVQYVQNVTDIDDPLLERARETGEDWTALAARETERFRADMTALRVLAPQHYVGAVEAMPAIVALIDRLREKGGAYDLDGDLYFPVSSDSRFGTMIRLDRGTMLALCAERGGDPERPGKKDPLDALLWHAASSERPGQPSWPAPFGPGRPGWHIECAAIALELLGAGFDIQGGGNDLAFPHHETSAAHARVATGQPFARTYLHAGMVELDGEKMSKSRGNLVFVSTLRRDGADPMAIRLALLAHHYREDWDWTPDQQTAAEARLARWRAAVSRPDGPPAQHVVDAVRRCLADDLNAPAALRVVDEWVREQEQRGGFDEAGPGLVSRTVDALLGVAL
jgi:L-cysteine:1D-myo-inositol 2-amino-2-deoxy-alpha-D-glucopyranoside ligase